MRAYRNRSVLLCGNCILLFFLMVFMPLREAFAQEEQRTSFVSPAESEVPVKDMLIDVRFRGEDDIFDQCVESGRTVKYRYSFRICKSRIGWFSTCLDTRRQIHHMETDPIRDAYRVTVDRHGDTDEPVTTVFKSKRLAYKALATVPQLSLAFLGAKNLEFSRSQRGYLDVQVESFCQGRYNKTLARISYFLTFGLIDIVGFDSGWQEFPLADLEQGGVVELR